MQNSIIVLASQPATQMGFLLCFQSVLNEGRLSREAIMKENITIGEKFQEIWWDLTLVKKSKSLGLVGSVRVEVQYDKVARDVYKLPWRASPVEAGHHLICVAIQ